MNNITNNKTLKKDDTFYWFYSFVKKDSTWKIVKETKKFDNINDFLSFVKDKWNDLFIWTSLFFDKELNFNNSLQELEEELNNIFEIWIKTITKNDNKELNNIYNDDDIFDFIKKNKKELEIKKEKKEKEINERKEKLLKRKEELEYLLKEYENLNEKLEKIVKIKDMISYINKELNKIL